jgi:hypothetical protein
LNHEKHEKHERLLAHDVIPETREAESSGSTERRRRKQIPDSSLRELPG